MWNMDCSFLLSDLASAWQRGWGWQTSFWFRPHCFCCVDQVVLMLTRCLYTTKAVSSVAIRARPPPASLPFKRQGTECTAVNWSIINLVWKISLKNHGSRLPVKHNLRKKQPYHISRGRKNSISLQLDHFVMCMTVKKRNRGKIKR